MEADSQHNTELGAALLDGIIEQRGVLNLEQGARKSERNIDLIVSFLQRQQTVEENDDPELGRWLEYFATDRREAALSFWYEMHKGIQEPLCEF